MSWNEKTAAGGEVARPDFERHRRKGVPEVILAERKSVEQSLTIARRFLEVNGLAILSRVSPELEERLRDEFEGQADVDWLPGPRAAVLRRPGDERPRCGGRVGILTAGTSDVPWAEEAAILCREMGCDVHTIYDVGVSGLHRLWEPLHHLLDEVGVDVIVVAAGMDGALPSVVSGLVDVPVIGLPTSVGYGLGGGGEAALLSMLQTCSPGMAVVNIDNGIGAGAMAGIIARRAAEGRERA
ncbi:MAG: nickel pincer cofactor biosynthesis protein LarB [Anaerolineae bacterium]|jgi:NCAIR mutase (PurE)-related protein|nr:nickel pincer cofactor biosynthesis protein LarB [Anaerolineae bacterium]MDX9828824.1 nickel pincer cofactor biosynthesis protein LarB [Anaerolineae bacterium]